MKKLLVTFVSFIVFIMVFFLVSIKIDVILVLIISVSLHEFGHMAILKKMGFSSHLIFLPLIGAVVSPNDTDRYLAAPKYDRAIVALAGPVINAVLAILSFALNQIGFYPDFFETMFVLNFILVAINIAPLMVLDGGKIYDAICESLSGFTKTLVSVYSGIVGLMGMLVIFFGVNEVLNKINNLALWDWAIVALCFFVAVLITRQGLGSKFNTLLSSRNRYRLLTVAYLGLTCTTLIFFILLMQGFKLTIF